MVVTLSRDQIRRWKLIGVWGKDIEDLKRIKESNELLINEMEPIVNLISTNEIAAQIILMKYHDVKSFSSKEFTDSWNYIKMKYVDKYNKAKDIVEACTFIIANPKDGRLWNI